MLVTEMPRVLPGPAAELNATQEKRENEKNRENAEANFTSPRRNLCTAQKRLRDHCPKMKRRNPIRQFPTLCVRNCASSNRTSPHRQSYGGCKSTAGVSSTGLRLWRERVDHSVHRSPCALHRTVRDVLSGNRRIFRHVPCRADRPSLNAANANPQREKY